MVGPPAPDKRPKDGTTFRPGTRDGLRSPCRDLAARPVDAWPGLLGLSYCPTLAPELGLCASSSARGAGGPRGAAGVPCGV